MEGAFEIETHIHHQMQYLSAFLAKEISDIYLIDAKKAVVRFDILFRLLGRAIYTK